jgi:hypothetical protein
MCADPVETLTRLTILWAATASEGCRGPRRVQYLSNPPRGGRHHHSAGKGLKGYKKIPYWRDFDLETPVSHAAHGSLMSPVVLSRPRFSEPKEPWSDSLCSWTTLVPFHAASTTWSSGRDPSGSWTVH